MISQPGKPGSHRHDPPSPRIEPAWTREDYARLLLLRTRLREFQRWSEQQARAVGMTPAIHQLLLAVAGHPEPAGPSITDVAQYLLLRHHSVVALVDRAERGGWLRRTPDPRSGRVVRLVLTPLAETRLAALSARHHAELRQLSSMFAALSDDASAGGLP